MNTPKPPRQLPADTSLPEAHRVARESREPLWVPQRYHVDDRGWSLMNQLQGVLEPAGQINYGLVYPGVIKAWHRHQQQSDFWLILHGHAQVGVHDEASDQRWLIVLGEKRPGLIIIPPPLWHGMACVGPEACGLLYYVTQQYDPQQPDEERRAYDALPDFPWGSHHR